MLERTDVITNEVLEPITIVLAYPTVRPLYLHNMISLCKGEQYRNVGFTEKSRTALKSLDGEIWGLLTTLLQLF